MEDDFHKSLTQKDSTLVKTQKIVDEAEAALKKARLSHGTAYEGRSQLINQYDRQKTTIERQLIESADPRINEAIAFFENALLESRTNDRVDVKKFIRGYRVGGEEAWGTTTNYQAIIDKHSYLRNAIITLEAMKLKPAYDEAAVQALIEGIPGISIFKEA